MKKSELMKLLENISDEQEVDAVINSSDIGKSLLSLDAFKEKLKSDKDFKSYIESENDKYHNKALNTWKENNLEKELEPFIQKKYPDLIKDPITKEMMELKKELADERAANAKKDLLTQAINYASEKKIPTNFIERFLGEDIDSTKENINELVNTWNTSLESSITEKLKSSTYVPGSGGAGGGGSDELGSRIAKQQGNQIETNKTVDNFFN